MTSTSPTLRDKAHAAANGQPAAAARSPQPSVEPLENIEYTGPIQTVEQVPVVVAFTRVMADVQSVRKEDRRDDTGGHYNFRGVDRVVNAVGPALRRHGVVVIPSRVFDVEYRETRTSGNKPMQECTLKVEWIVYGPTGDRLEQPLQSAGQANDTSDKATAKAISVAQRVLFLTALHIPTEDPTIDQGHDRGERPIPRPADYRDEALDLRTSFGRIRVMHKELTDLGFSALELENENGDLEPLGPMLKRIGDERRGH